MDELDIAKEIVERLEKAWNSADGAAFGEPFAADADFVAIRGDLHAGPAIAPGHQQLFDTIYAGSTIQYEVLQARALDDRVILAHAKNTLTAPTGPLVGEHTALASVVLVRADDGYHIAAFHNTLIAE